MVTWKDPTTPFEDVVMLAVTAMKGSALLVKLNCRLDVASEMFPTGSCSTDDDCAMIPNTVCRRGTIDTTQEEETLGETTIPFMFTTCQCMDGYMPIPGIEFKLLLNP